MVISSIFLGGCPLTASCRCGSASGDIETLLLSQSLQFSVASCSHAVMLSKGSVLCRDHPELSEVLCVELMTRQLEPGGSTELQHQVLSCLAPWMQNLSFAARWEGGPLNTLLSDFLSKALSHD